MKRPFVVGLGIIVVAAVVGVMATYVMRGPGEWGTRYDVLLDRPGVTVEYLKRGDGGGLNNLVPVGEEASIDEAEVRRFVLPGPVVIVERRTDGGYTATATDNSGLGAVNCTWEIYATVSFHLEKCEAIRDPDLILSLNGALDRVEVFMRENALRPTSEAEFARWKERWRERQEEWFQQEGAEQACQNEHITHFANSLKSMSDEEFATMFDKLLSVPRLPVLNPCL